MSLGFHTIAAGIAPGSALVWGYALWPFGVWAGVAGGVCGAVGGLLGAKRLARQEELAVAAGGLRGYSGFAVTLVGLWLLLVIVPSFIGAAVWSHHRPKVEPNPPLQQVRRDDWE